MQIARVIALILLIVVSVPRPRCYVISAPQTANHLLDPETFHSYYDRFSQQERDFLQDDATVSWPWFRDNIPWIDVPDKQMEEIYYFRWYALQKHIRRTPRGYIFDEFLDMVPWAGPFNSINDAAEHHVRDARWLRDQVYAEQYLRFWFSPDGEPRRYSLSAADMVYQFYLSSGKPKIATNLLLDLVANYHSWEKTHQDPNGLFWQIDDRDGMEKSISGDGYRPTINSYMYGDAVAISKIALLAGKPDLAREFDAKAAALRELVETNLWNSRDGFYETVSRMPNAHSADVRELIGYIPWYFNLPPAEHATAWKQLTDSQGFAGAFGPTTAERRQPRYRFTDAHECLWNGPSWPFATTQTLVALANLLNGPPQNTIEQQQYFELLKTYVRSQHIHMSDGRVIPWIDEDLDPDNGEWIARGILERAHQPPANRGRYYNHSGFADLMITGLFGLRPSSDNTLVIHPLLPTERWEYFALDGLPYHGHLLTIFYEHAIIAALDFGF
jgi:hypothetical protein